MMSNSGWIKWHRKILDSGIMEADNPAEAIGMFNILACMAGHDERKVFNKIPAARGQVVTSKAKLKELLHFRHSKLERYLNQFIEAGMIECGYVGKALIITIVNYDKYQGTNKSVTVTNVTDNATGSVIGNVTDSVTDSVTGNVTQSRSIKECVKNDIRKERRGERVYD